MKAWHHAPFGHITFAGPHRHVAAAGRSVSHCDRAGLGVNLAPLAWTKPTDMTIAKHVKANVLSIVLFLPRLRAESLCGPRVSDVNLDQ
jgi:hypothetical protein